jgi:molybdopterin converting factor small subunit
MIITVKLFAGYRVGRFREKALEFPAGTPARRVIAALAIPHSEASIILVNGTRVELNHPLQDGDTLTLLPLIAGG